MQRSLTQFELEDEVLSQWENLRQSATRREMTGDRILLAEFFRRQVEKISIEDAETVEQEKKAASHTMSYVKYVEDMVGSNVATSMGSGGINRSAGSDGSSNNGDKNGSLRLVVISDTHGYEQGLTPGGTTLPDGDILLHLGDFAIDSSIKKKNKAIEKFDAWLALQPHRTKIVLRGNHDPFSVHFPLSGSNFFSRPKSIAIDGKLTMTLVPYTSARNLSSSWRKLPMFCDVIASHSPPKNVLDKCYNGANAGCQSLRSKVERMIAGPPHLWLCGHIHEARGSKKVAFGLSPRETLVVNVANADAGRATRIDAGPVVLDIDADGNINMIEGDGIIPAPMEEKKQVESVAAVAAAA